MAGISSPAAFKRVNSVTFFSGHRVERGRPFPLAANVFLHRDWHNTFTEHHSVNNLPTVALCTCFICMLLCHGSFNKNTTAKYNAFKLKKKKFY